MLTKHEVVMRYWGKTVFGLAGFVPDETVGMVEIDYEAWEEMGRPEEVTVAVTPGGIGGDDE